MREHEVWLYVWHKSSPRGLLVRALRIDLKWSTSDTYIITAQTYDLAGRYRLSHVFMMRYKANTIA